MTTTNFVPLKDFAATWADRAERPPWAPPDSEPPLPLDHLGIRARIEDVVDTVVAVQRADWLQDGVYVGSRANPEVYRDLLHCARTLQVSVPPAISTTSTLPSSCTAGGTSSGSRWLCVVFRQTTATSAGSSSAAQEKMRGLSIEKSPSTDSTFKPCSRTWS